MGQRTDNDGYHLQFDGATNFRHGRGRADYRDRQHRQLPADPGERLQAVLLAQGEIEAE